MPYAQPIPRGKVYPHLVRGPLGNLLAPDTDDDSSSISRANVIYRFDNRSYLIQLSKLWWFATYHQEILVDRRGGRREGVLRVT